MTLRACVGCSIGHRPMIWVFKTFFRIREIERTSNHVRTTRRKKRHTLFQKHVVNGRLSHLLNFTSLIPKLSLMSKNHVFRGLNGKNWGFALPLHISAGITTETCSGREKIEIFAFISETPQVVLKCFWGRTNICFMFLFPWLDSGIDISDFEKIDFLGHERFLAP